MFLCIPSCPQLCYCFILGEDEHIGISAAVSFWSFLCLCQTQRAGVQEHCVDC